MLQQLSYKMKKCIRRPYLFFFYNYKVLERQILKNKNLKKTDFLLITIPKSIYPDENYIK